MKKVEFFNTVPGVLEAWPIESMGKAIPKWVKSARDDYVKTKDLRGNHIFRCSGIGDLYKTGYVVRAWHDIYVSADDHNLNDVIIPNVDSTNFLGKHTVSVQSGDDVAKFLPKRPWSSKSILKINTPWHVVAPCKFIMNPIAYSDSVEFEACIGILDPEVSTEINVQMYWNNTSGKPFIIEAGTPLCHLIPIYEKDLELVVRDATPKDMEWLKRRFYINTMSFNLNIRKVKEAYRKFFNRSKCPFHWKK